MENSSVDQNSPDGENAIPVPKAPTPKIIADAEQAGRLSVAALSDAFSKTGIAIKPVSDGVLILVTEHIKQVPYHPVIKWEGPEHTFIGNNATLHFPGGDQPASQVLIPMANTAIQLTYGQIVSLAGDFYGIPGSPISDDPKPPKVFAQAFNTLYYAAITELSNILSIMQAEINAVNYAVAKGQNASQVYLRFKADNGKWNVATGGGSALTPLYPLGRYLELAATNWDHFGAHAIKAYTIGHNLAMKSAADTSNPDRLMFAYAMNAFADHFLTDLFSSGHVRTPRKKLYEATSIPAMGSYLSKFMHDEDSCFGLTVSNQLGDVWTAYGDKRLFDKKNSANMTMVETAVQKSIDEIWAAYSTGTIAKQPAALDYVPNLSQFASTPPDSQNNFSPMFFFDGKEVQVRTLLSNRKDYSFTSNWNGAQLLTELEFLPEFAECYDIEIPFTLSLNIVQLWPNGDYVGLNVYGPGSNSDYNLVFSNNGVGPMIDTTVAWFIFDVVGSGEKSIIQVIGTDTYISFNIFPPLAGNGYDFSYGGAFSFSNTDTVSWLFGDVTGNGQNSLIQMWNNGGNLAMRVFSPAEDGKSFSVSWSNDDMGLGSGSIAWLTGDPAANGQTGIFQLWNNNGSLGINLFSPQADGSYTLSWYNENMGLGFGAIVWLTGDTTGDGKTSIFQVWDNSGVVAMNIFSPQPDGSYALSWSSQNLGPGSAAIFWLTGDTTGAGKTSIFQLFDNAGTLGMNIFSPHDDGSYKVSFHTLDLGAPSAAITFLSAKEGENGATNIIQLWNNDGNLAMNVFAPDDNGHYILTGVSDLNFPYPAMQWFAAPVMLD